MGAQYGWVGSNGLCDFEYHGWNVSVSGSNVGVSGLNGWKVPGDPDGSGDFVGPDDGDSAEPLSIVSVLLTSDDYRVESGPTAPGPESPGCDSALGFASELVGCAVGSGIDSVGDSASHPEAGSGPDPAWLPCWPHLQSDPPEQAATVPSWKNVDL